MIRDIHFAMCHSRPISQTNPYVASSSFPYQNKNHLLSPFKIDESDPRTTSKSNGSKSNQLRHIDKNRALLIANRRHIQTSSNRADEMPHEIEMLLRENSASNFVKSNSIEFYDNVNMNMSDDYTYYPYPQIKNNSRRRPHHISDPQLNYSIERF